MRDTIKLAIVPYEIRDILIEDGETVHNATEAYATFFGIDYNKNYKYQKNTKSCNSNDILVEGDIVLAFPPIGDNIW